MVGIKIWNKLFAIFANNTDTEESVITAGNRKGLNQIVTGSILTPRTGFKIHKAFNLNLSFGIYGQFIKQIIDMIAINFQAYKIIRMFYIFALIKTDDHRLLKLVNNLPTAGGQCKTLFCCAVHTQIVTLHDNVKWNQAECDQQRGKESFNFTFRAVHSLPVFQNDLGCQ